MPAALLYCRDFAVRLSPAHKVRRGMSLYTDLCGAVVPCQVLDILDGQALVRIDYRGFSDEINRPIGELYRGTRIPAGGSA